MKPPRDLEPTYRDEAYLVGEEPEIPAIPVAPAPEPVVVGRAEPGIDNRPLEEAAVSPEDDLSSLYVQRDASKAGRLTVYEGMPDPETKGIARLIKAFVVLLILAAVATVPVLVKKSYVGLDGTEHEVSLYRWVQVFFTMEPEMKAMQKLNEDERAFAVTHRRVEEISFAAAGVMADTGFWPRSVRQLVESGSITEENSRDGYGNDIVVRVQPDQEIKIISPGADGLVGNSDDVALYKDQWSYPPKYQSELIDQTLSF